MKNRRNSNKLFWNNMNLTFPPNFRLFSELVFFLICLLYPFSIQWTNSKYHRCSTTKILLSKMWSFSYHVANFFTNWWTISFRDVTVHFLNQNFAISNYASLQCYDTVSRTTCTTTWFDERWGFDSYLYPLKQVWQLSAPKPQLSSVKCANYIMVVTSGQS